MTDIEIAKSLLTGGNTCVLSKDGQTFISKERGIKPMMQIIASGTDVSSFSVADKIVGKAAAMLFVKAGVKEVYAETLSRAGLAFLQSHGIKTEYNLLCDMIINRNGDGMCPMEQTVLDTEDIETGYILLKEKIAQLSKTQIS